MSGVGQRIRRCLSDERGVFIPALMGAGILTSVALLAADGIRKLVPLDGARARAARAQAAASGRAHDLMAVATGVPPLAVRVTHVPRSRHGAVLVGIALDVVAVLVARSALTAYSGDAGVLADRGWTLSFGLGAAGLFGALGVLVLVSALLGPRRPGWLHRIATWPPIGTYPTPARRPGETAAGRRRNA